MNMSTGNFTTFESTNSTASSFGDVTVLDMCVYIIHLLFGFPAHTYVIWLIVTKAGSGVASEFFSLNLSVCEVIYCLNSLFSLICFKYFPGLKDLLWFLLGVGVTGRPLFQCLMCVERYLAVVHPVTFLKYKPLRYRLICSTVGWMFTFGSCLCLVFQIASFNPYLYAWLCSVQFSIFASTQLFCCLAVLRALKQSGPGERKREREENHMKRRAFHLILISTVSMSIIYVPFVVSGFSFVLTGQYSSDLFTVMLFCFILFSFVPPVLYLHRNGKLSFVIKH